MRVIRQTGDYAYSFGRYAEPIATVKPGETVVIETADAYAGVLNREDMIPSVDLAEQIAARRLNPQTGPILIEGAEPGDTLAVHIQEIQLDRDWAVSAIFPNAGALNGNAQTRMLTENLPEKVYIYKRDGDVYKAGENLSIGISPFLGTMGTAPALEAVSSLVPFRHGGNMDCKDVCKGHTVYLPVATTGAHFYIGDCHVNQGDGEICSAALEISAKITLHFELYKGKVIGWPRIESESEYMTVGSMRPLEDAARIAYCEMIEWLQELGWEQLDAYQLLTQCCSAYIANLCNPAYTVVVKISKKKANFYKNNP